MAVQNAKHCLSLYCSLNASAGDVLHLHLSPQILDGLFKKLSNAIIHYTIAMNKRLAMMIKVGTRGAACVIITYAPPVSSWPEPESIKL